MLVMWHELMAEEEHTQHQGSVHQLWLPGEEQKHGRILTEQNVLIGDE